MDSYSRREQLLASTKGTKKGRMAPSFFMLRLFISLLFFLMIALSEYAPDTFWNRLSTNFLEQLSIPDFTYGRIIL